MRRLHQPAAHSERAVVQAQLNRLSSRRVDHALDQDSRLAGKVAGRPFTCGVPFALPLVELPPDQNLENRVQTVKPGRRDGPRNDDVALLEQLVPGVRHVSVP